MEALRSASIFFSLVLAEPRFYINNAAHSCSRPSEGSKSDKEDFRLSIATSPEYVWLPPLVNVTEGKFCTTWFVPCDIARLFDWPGLAIFGFASVCLLLVCGFLQRRAALGIVVADWSDLSFLLRFRDQSKRHRHKNQRQLSAKSGHPNKTPKRFASCRHVKPLFPSENHSAIATLIRCPRYPNLRLIVASLPSIDIFDVGRRSCQPQFYVLNPRSPLLPPPPPCVLLEYNTSGCRPKRHLCVFLYPPFTATLTPRVVWD